MGEASTTVNSRYEMIVSITYQQAWWYGQRKSCLAILTNSNKFEARLSTSDMNSSRVLSIIDRNTSAHGWPGAGNVDVNSCPWTSKFSLHKLFNPYAELLDDDYNSSGMTSFGGVATMIVISASFFPRN